MNVDTGTWKALTAEAEALRAEVAVAVATKDAVIQRIAELYGLGFKDGIAAAAAAGSEPALSRPPLRLVR